LAWLAKKVYLVLAWDSPANAASRFFSVWLPLNSKFFILLCVEFVKGGIKGFLEPREICLALWVISSPKKIADLNVNEF